MTLKLITAIISVLKLEKVESELRRIGVPGISVSSVKGYGHYKNFYQRDWLQTHARIQIYVKDVEVSSIVKTIAEAASTGSEHDGIIAVLPVDHIYTISEVAGA